MSSIYTGLSKAFEAADASADISWWSVNLGFEMPTRWPEFEVLFFRKMRNRALPLTF